MVTVILTKEQVRALRQAAIHSQYNYKTSRDKIVCYWCDRDPKEHDSTCLVPHMDSAFSALCTEDVMEQELE